MFSSPLPSHPPLQPFIPLPHQTHLIMLAVYLPTENKKRIFYALAICKTNLTTASNSSTTLPVPILHADIEYYYYEFSNSSAFIHPRSEEVLRLLFFSRGSSEFFEWIRFIGALSIAGKWRLRDINTLVYVYETSWRINLNEKRS